MLFFDILNGYYHKAAPATKLRLKPMVDNAVKLMKASRNSGIPIFFAKGNHRADDATTRVVLSDTDVNLRPWPDGVITKGKHLSVAGDPSSDIIPELEPRDEDYYVPKYRRSAFYQTYFDLALRARGIDTIIICGTDTDVGIAATVFAARDMDYNVIVSSDGCTTPHDRRAHDTLINLVFPRMCRVRTTDQILQMIEAASSVRIAKSFI
jgi:nicotinamidase-related amidase